MTELAAPASQPQPGTTTAAARHYTCQAFGSNAFTPSTNTHRLTGYATLGFLEACTNPKNTIKSSCALTATIRPPLHTNTGRNNQGGVNCSTDTVVGANARKLKGSYAANWGAANTKPGSTA